MPLLDAFMCHVWLFKNIYCPLTCAFSICGSSRQFSIIIIIIIIIFVLLGSCKVTGLFIYLKHNANIYIHMLYCVHIHIHSYPSFTIYTIFISIDRFSSVRSGELIFSIDVKTVEFTLKVAFYDINWFSNPLNFIKVRPLKLMKYHVLRSQSQH